MKLLIVKTTSLGDLVHTMPAVNDIARQCPDVEIQWLVEESFKHIPFWHPSVSKVHGCAIRRWRKSLFSRQTRQQIQSLKMQLKNENFDLVIDAQGLIKSAWMVRWLDCDKHGYDKNSIKEPMASLAYSKQYAISRDLTAIERVRELFACSLGYSIDALPLSFGMSIDKPSADECNPVLLETLLNKPMVLFMHGTVWESKVWPLSNWQALARKLDDEGVNVLLPWGNDQEKTRAEAIAASTNATVLPKLSLNVLAYLLQQASFVVGSDTGLSHIAAAMGTRTIAMYGPTSADLTGLVGDDVVNLQSIESCSPCFKRKCPIETSDNLPCYRSVAVDKVLEHIHVR